MPVLRKMPALILLAALASAGVATASVAADQPPGVCLSQNERRAAIADKKAVPLSEAIKSLREGGRRAEVVRAELCQEGGKMVYVLTLLARSGKVTRATIDAASGEPISGL